MATIQTFENERFSIFPAGWWDDEKKEAKPRQRPQQTQDIEWVYQYIISDRARWATLKLREMVSTAETGQKETETGQKQASTEQEQASMGQKQASMGQKEASTEQKQAATDQKQVFKALHFEYATFAGIFSYRNARSLVMRSPFVAMDIDGLSSMEEARSLQQVFIQDTTVETALCFLSPKGLGVKWIVVLPEWLQGLSFKEQYERLRRYVGFTYGVDSDKNCSDVCRACYLPWDPQCYVNPKYISAQ